MVVSVFLVDDHEVVRRGIVDLLAADPELDVVGEAGSVAEAMTRIAAVRPGVAVLDVRLPDGSGIELCRDLLSDIPDLRCLMLTSFTSDEAMLDAILAGASGYVVKDIKGMELAQAIKDVGAGRSLLDNRAAAALMAKLRGNAERSDPLGGLTDQERTLLGLLVRDSPISRSRPACSLPKKQSRTTCRGCSPSSECNGGRKQRYWATQSDASNRPGRSARRRHGPVSLWCCEPDSQLGRGRASSPRRVVAPATTRVTS